MLGGILPSVLRVCSIPFRSRFYGDLTPPRLLLRYRDGNLKNPVVELGSGFVQIGALRQRDTPIKAAIAPLRTLESFSLLVMLALALALNDQGIVCNFDFHVVFVQAR